ncbi:hypothetical protein Tco_1523720 [Tanacetum coccineum]
MVLPMLGLVVFRVPNIVKDELHPSEYNVEHVNTLIAQASPFLRFSEEFLCWVGISRNYLLNKDTYPRFEYEDGEVMDLNAFIRIADPRKIKGRLWDYGGSVTGASPLEVGGDRTDSVTGPSLRTIGPSARFVVLSDSSHHSGAKSADPEVDSLVRSAAPVMTEAITVSTVATTVAIPADGGQGNGFDAGSIRAVRGVGAGSKEFFVLWRGPRSQFELSSEEESAEVTQLRAKVSGLEATEKFTYEAKLLHELSDLGASSSSLMSQNQGLVNQVHELEISPADLREKLEMYEGNTEHRVLISPPKRRCGAKMVLTHGIMLLVREVYLTQMITWEAHGQPFGRAAFQQKDATANGLLWIFLVWDDAVAETVEDYDNPDSADMVPENATLGSESEGKIDASAEELSYLKMYLLVGILISDGMYALRSVSPSSSTTVKHSFSFKDFSFLIHPPTLFTELAQNNLVDAILVNESDFLFLLLGLAFIEKRTVVVSQCFTLFP